MKRLLPVVGLCVAAFVGAPVASANAERAVARCTVEGRATFLRTNLGVLPTPKLGYEFHGPVTCEILPSREIRVGIADAEGEETLSCAGSLGEGGGKGTLTFGEVKLPFTLTFFSGAPGSTALAAKFADGGVAIGGVTFLGSESEPAAACFSLGGAHSLQFKGAAVGEL
jgi:hypothetical protein